MGPFQLPDTFDVSSITDASLGQFTVDLVGVYNPVVDQPVNDPVIEQPVVAVPSDLPVYLLAGSMAITLAANPEGEPTPPLQDGLYAYDDDQNVLIPVAEISTGFYSATDTGVPVLLAAEGFDASALGLSPEGVLPYSDGQSASGDEMPIYIISQAADIGGVTVPPGTYAFDDFTDPDNNNTRSTDFIPLELDSTTGDYVQLGSYSDVIAVDPSADTYLATITAETA